jgi:hypothetical protein
MTKCYFCGDIKAGCPECHARRRNAQQRQAGASSFLKTGPAPDGSLLMPVQKAPGAYYAGDGALDKAEKPRAMSWEAAVVWAQQVQKHIDQVDSNIRCELVRDPSHPTYILYTRWTIDDHPDFKRRPRMQNWGVQELKEPSAVASRILHYVAQRRVRARDEFAKPQPLAEPIHVKGSPVTLKYDADVKTWTVEGHLPMTPELKAWRDGEWELPDDFTTYVNPDHAMKAPTISEMEESIARIESLFPNRTPPKLFPWQESVVFKACELGRPDPLDDIAYRVGQWHAARREQLFSRIYADNDDFTAGQLLGGVLDDNTED